jgi:hypothetical protein
MQVAVVVAHKLTHRGQAQVAQAVQVAVETAQ